MNKKEIKSQAGFSTADILISLAIIIVVLNVILMIYTNLRINSKNIDRKTGATKIAINISENIEMMLYDEFSSIYNNFSKNEENKYIVNGGEGVTLFNTKIPTGYTVILSENNKFENDIIKDINIKVEYKVDNNLKEISFNKTLKREDIRECNSPMFKDIYLEQLGIYQENYCLWNKNLNTSEFSKIICPIKYNMILDEYKVIDITSDLNQIWYSYSNSDFATVLVLNNDEISKINENDVIPNEIILEMNSKMFIWVPRYDYCTDGIRFLYKDTDFPIKNSYYDEKSLNYYYIDTSGSTTRSFQTDFKSIDNKEIYGRWEKY